MRFRSAYGWSLVVAVLGLPLNARGDEPLPGAADFLPSPTSPVGFAGQSNGAPPLEWWEARPTRAREKIGGVAHTFEYGKYPRTAELYAYADDRPKNLLWKVPVPGWGDSLPVAVGKWIISLSASKSSKQLATTATAVARRTTGSKPGRLRARATARDSRWSNAQAAGSGAHLRWLASSRRRGHSRVPPRRRSVSRALAGPPVTPYNCLGHRSFHLCGDRSMARTSSLAWVLVALCLSRPAPAGEPAATPRATTPQVQQAVGSAVKYLQTESATWLHTRKCAACHHVPLPLWALGEAERQGYAVDRKFVADTIESLLGSKDRLLSSRIFPNPADPPDPRPQGRGLNMGLPMLAVAARSWPALSEGQKQSLKLIADEIVKKQQADGSWEFFATLRRPPINESQTTDAAWIILALQGETGPDAPGAQRAALAKGVAWLDAAKPSDLHQDKALRVLLGVRSGKPRKALQPTIDELLALQRADGGWSQTVTAPRSDAFATGQTLYILALAGWTAERPEIKRGLDFLVATQKADGSWPMASRATPDGSPGSATLLTPITCAASSWATLGLARLAPRR
jgi:hypothetical protein